MKKWINLAAPLFDRNGRKLTTIPERAVVVSHGYAETFSGILREAVSYQAGVKQYEGFIYSGYLEPYFESLPINCVKIAAATPNPYDAEQYAIVHGVTQVNLCGELCAAYLLDVSLDGVLTEWERGAQPIYRRVFDWFATKRARGTSASEIISIFETFNRSASLLTNALRDETLKTVRYTVSGLAMLAGRVIVGVQINKYSGRLQPSGVPHWVVVANVVPERAGYGWVHLYNPFSNRIEVYSWNEFATSAGAPVGVVVGK